MCTRGKMGLHDYELKYFILRTRGKNILEQLSRPRFFPGFEISRPFPHLFSTEKRAGNFKPGKNRDLESCSNIIFPSNQLFFSSTYDKFFEALLLC